VFDASLGADGKATFKMSLVPVYQGQTGSLMIAGTSSSQRL
jgi:hypothetical protein